jgi:hypothetical protein
MTTETMPEPEGPEDERFVYVVTAAGVEALRRGAAAFDSEAGGATSNRQSVRDPRCSGAQDR